MNTNKQKQLISNIMLITAAAIWDNNFIFQKNATEIIGAFLFMALRSFLGAATLIPITLVIQRNQKTEYTRRSFLRLLVISAFCGCVTITGPYLSRSVLRGQPSAKPGF